MRLKTTRSLLGPLSLVISIVILGSSLCACGFHLRQQDHLPPKLHALVIAPNQPWDPFQHLLVRHLEASGASFSKHSAPSTVKLLTVQMTDTDLAYGPDGPVHRARLEYMVRFSVEDAQHQLLLPEQSVIIRRDYRINPNSKLSSDEEKAVIIQEMIRSAVEQVVQRLTTIE